MHPFWVYILMCFNECTYICVDHYCNQNAAHVHDIKNTFASYPSFSPLLQLHEHANTDVFSLLYIWSPFLKFYVNRIIQYVLLYICFFFPLRIMVFEMHSCCQIFSSLLFCYLLNSIPWYDSHCFLSTYWLMNI